MRADQPAAGIDSVNGRVRAHSLAKPGFLLRRSRLMFPDGFLIALQGRIDG
jgi:hypothetical protein